MQSINKNNTDEPLPTFFVTQIYLVPPVPTPFQTFHPPGWLDNWIKLNYRSTVVVLTLCNFIQAELFNLAYAA
jgi:hypothetical protein